MSELIETIEKGLKKIAEFLEIEEAGEVHHSEPYNEPKGHVDQLMKGETGYSPQQKKYDELAFLNRLEAPVFTTQNDIFGHVRQWRGRGGRVLL